MKVTLGPLVSRISGRYGGTVASNWKGIDLIRRFKAPANPNTTDQQEVRRLFINITAWFVRLTTYTRAAWNTQAAGRPYIGRNRAIALNIPVLQGTTTLAALVPVPGDASTVPPAALVITPGDAQLTATITAPAIPTGWSITRAIAACVESVDWTTTVDPNALVIRESTDESSPYAPVITGLSNGLVYRLWAFLEWLAPDGSTRYSAALSGNGTPSA
jgi:hypothetical protein